MNKKKIIGFFCFAAAIILALSPIAIGYLELKYIFAAIVFAIIGTLLLKKRKSPKKPFDIEGFLNHPKVSWFQDHPKLTIFLLFAISITVIIIGIIVIKFLCGEIASSINSIGNSGGGNSCGVCGGSGMVSGFSTCPNCRGTGIPPL